MTIHKQMLRVYGDSLRGGLRKCLPSWKKPSARSARPIGRVRCCLFTSCAVYWLMPSTSPWLR